MSTFITAYQGAGGRIDIGYDISQSIENNTSTITATAYVVKTNASYYSYRTAPQTFSLTVNGTAVTYGWTFNFSNMTLGTRYAITTNVQTVPHNPDGSRAAVSASVYCASGTDGLGTINGSVSIPVATIPRASSISSISGGALGSQVSVWISRASDTFTHTVIYRRTDGVDVTVGTGQTTSCIFTPALSDATLLPNATSGTASIIVHTYSGGTYVGTASANFTVTVPASVVPVISSVSKSEAVSGIAGQFGTYVQNRSQMAVNISAAGAQGSSIVSCSTSILGVNYSGTSFTTNVLGSAGSIAVTTTIVDSRGRSASTTGYVTVAAYASPSIASFGAVRALSNGTESASEGTYLKAAMAFSVASVGDKNTKSWTLSYRPAGGSWSTVTSGSTYSYNSSYTSTTGILGVDSSYEARLTVSDWFTSTTATVPISTAFVLMDFNAAGTGMAIGKVASGNGVLDVAGDVYVDGSKINGAQKNSDITKAEIEAKLTGEVASHSHSYLPLAGGTVSGNVTASSMYTSNWFRTTGATGWYSETYGGGIYMADSTYVRTYNSKAFLTDGGLVIGTGKDLDLAAASGTPNDSGDIVFRSNSFAELGRIYQIDGTLHSRGSGGTYDGIIRNLANCNIASGTASLTSAWSSISFYTGFYGVPKVIMSADSSTVSGEVNEPKVKNVTASGFEACVSGTGQACTYSWIAIWSAY